MRLFYMQNNNLTVASYPHRHLKISCSGGNDALGSAVFIIPVIALFSVGKSGENIGREKLASVGMPA